MRCPVGAGDDEKGTGDDGWPIGSAMTAKGAGDEVRSAMTRREPGMSRLASCPA